MPDFDPEYKVKRREGIGEPEASPLHFSEENAVALIYIPILSYHRIIDGVTSPLCVTPAEFRRQMTWLHEQGYRGVTLADAVAGRAGRLSGQAGGAGSAARGLKAFTVTFDHGYVDNYRNALPLLKELRIPAHFFLVTDYIGTNRRLELPDRPNTDPERDRLMSWDELLDMKEAGMEMGSMGAAHSDLTGLAPDDAREDVARSRDAIRGFLGSEPAYFAYPFDRFNAAVKDIVKETGFRAAVYTPSGKTGGMDRYSLRRVAVPAGTSDKAFQFKLTENADKLREKPALFGIMKALGKAFE